MKAYNRAMKADMDLRAVYYIGGQRRGVYDDMIDKLASYIKRRINNKRQTVIVITGRTGTGKSTCAIQLARRIDPEWELEDRYVYGADDLRDLLKAGRGHRSINLFDEGSVSFNSLKSNARDDRDMVVLLDILRSWEMTTLICIPSFYDLNKRIREHLVDIWIHCPEKPLIQGKDARGYFEAYAPSMAQWSDKTYWNFLGAGKFSPLPHELDEIYQQIKYDHQMRQVREFIDGPQKKTRKKKEEDE